MMKIKLSDVNNASGRNYRFAFNLPADEFNFPTDDYQIIGTIEVSGIAENTGTGYHLQGSVKCQRHFICDRCLGKITEDQVNDFDEIYAVDAPETQKDVNLFSGDFVDITDLVHDVVIVAQPMANLCKPDCRGLCPKCGINLNEQQCDCET